MAAPPHHLPAKFVPVLWPAGLLIATPAVAAADEAFPMNYMRGMGPQAAELATHIWGFAGISVAVTIIIAVLVLLGILSKRLPPGTRSLPVIGSLAGNAWVVVGTGISTVVLVFSVAWAAVVLAGISAPANEPNLTVEVRGHQWWWQVKYIGKEPHQRFETANEIHIPVGEPVRFKLVTSDVIHSFWAPALGGKTDLIPGQTNYAWLEASEPGVYRGQCVEYCGLQHARMALRIYADAPEAFEAWRARQLQEAPEPANAQVAEGRKRFMARCAVCHTVRGTAAHGVVGPDLTHLMSRDTIAAGTLANTTANLSGWIANPQSIKPGARMPNLELSGPELDSIRAYITTLR